MARIDRFEDIKAWQEARALTKQVYILCREGELAKDFGLRDQIRRAAVSIGSNIAEGYGRDGNRELSRFLKIAQGSANEFRSQLYTLSDAGYIDEKTFSDLHERSLTVANLIGGFIRYLENDPGPAEL